jgi:Fuc2NAc and GlcNAc transferase
MLCFVITASSIGFLFWNRPPAKIFMGDVGSCVLGFTFAMLALLSDLSSLLPVNIWCILLAVFICDSTYTLILRVIKREKWYQAHRSHAYQDLIKNGLSHGRLAVLVSLINIFLLWPSAYLAYVFPAYSLAISIGVVTFMFALWAWVKFLLIKDLNYNES